MNVSATTGAFASAAGAPLSQLAGAETERASKDAAVQQRQAKSDAKSEAAAGIGETEQDQGTSERDADGRRLWELPSEAGRPGAEPAPPIEHHQVKDPTGIAGNSLDLTG
ncbi:hypothetical protein [Lacipirellula sp.]|uniref:hypothetical protein n=1 Tax=Lacipirellula sp. TaxID=2691419 RepID=UPI003D11558D